MKREKMLAIKQFCWEMRLGVIDKKVQPRLPRCLFGSPNPKDTRELLQETLGAERERFSKRWGIDPLAEENNKENAAAVEHTTTRAGGRCSVFVIKALPSERRFNPYAKQTSIHDYWRSRKNSDTCKKSSSSAFVEVSNQQEQPQLLLEQQSQRQSKAESQNHIDKIEHSSN